MRRAIFRAPRLEKLLRRKKIVARCDQSALLTPAVPHLLISDVREQPVAHALSAHGILGIAPLRNIQAHRLTPAAVSDAAIFGAIRLAQESKVADARPLSVNLGVGSSALQL